MLNTGDWVTIYEIVSGIINGKPADWCYIEFIYNGAKLKGYVAAEYVTINSDPIKPSDDISIDKIYKPYLDELKKKHPNWNFVVYDTGYDWNSLFGTDAQGAVGRSLIHSSYPISYRSTASGCYDWRTDKYIPQDANSWYQANTQTIAHYMDPRNFLTENYVFMFETLSYNKSSHNISGVKNILKGTFMANKTIAGLSPSTYLSYEQAFMNAAEHSNVSPYHLASRCIQEVSVNGSGSTSGNYNGYEGYYNFFNIGATHGERPIANGLYFAKTGSFVGSSSTVKNNPKYYIPWNTQYKAILGGAYWISQGYINSRHQQDTLYFQKFNTSNKDKDYFYHQYMANIMAPKGEAPKIFNAYKNLGVLDNSFTFRIPYYRNMPKAPASLPESNNYSSNNWLKSITVNNVKISNFDGAVTDGYTLTVPTTNYVNISAEKVNSKASVSGTGTVTLTGTNTRVPITVTAENGAKRVYYVNIVKSGSSIPLKGISLSNSNISLYMGSTYTLKVNYNPSNTTVNRSVVWSSSNNAVAKVNNGTITAIAPGYAEITAKCGSYTAKCSVTVTNSENIILGDVDADREITISDALYIFKFKSNEISLSDIAKKAADTDRDGSVTNADALRIFKYKSGEIDKL